MSTHDETAAQCPARRPVNYKSTTEHICTRDGAHGVHLCTCGTLWAAK